MKFILIITICTLIIAKSIDLNLQTVIIVIISTCSFITIGNLIWKNNIKRKTIMNVLQNYSLYCNPREYCVISDKHLIIKGQKYEMTDNLKVNYFLSSLESKNNILYLYINEDKYKFSNLIISLEYILSCVVILYLAQNNIDYIDFHLIKNILSSLETTKK